MTDRSAISDVFTVADEILKTAKREGLRLTPMQLVKLAYIAHGWSLAIMGRPLFSEPVEAWKYGPVIPALYHATKHHGRNPIPSELIDEEAESPLTERVRSFLEDFVKKYGRLSGVALSSLTHRHGTPWHQVYRKGVGNIPIDDARIAAHYKQKLDEYRNSAS
ncbi:MAG: SocA family protein [Hyphomonadaceae bacterium]|nr:SocA family protein [Hyphomonadaceae bacterium]